MTIFLRFCPQCGKPVEPGKKFCTSCGASLTPDFPQEGRETYPEPGGILPSQQASGAGPRGWLIVSGGLVILLLIGIFLGYPFLMETSFFGSSAAPVKQVMTPSEANESGSSPGGSYVIIRTEEPTPEPTTPPLPTITSLTSVTLVPATLATTQPWVTRSLTCSSDTIPCNNSCIDPRTDNNNCGDCKNSCSAGKFCQNGNCVATCTAEQASCAEGCFNLLTSARHCGSCGNSCPNGLICFMGRCDSPATPMPVPQ